MTAPSASPSASPPSPQVSIIVPALNEAVNFPLLLPRVAAALAGRSYEVIIVDDNSRDDTQAVCAELAKNYPLQLLVRPKPKDGLSGAVLYGIARSAGRYIVVMDADLQHPPEKIPELLEPLQHAQADFVLGSRYIPGGSTEGNWSVFRRLNSRIATLLARPFAGPIHDPMSGFFALRRETFAAGQRLTPLGYKIGLELMCKCQVARVREVPIHFSARQRGASKLTLKQQWKYLEHLSRLYDYRFPRLAPMFKFIAATATGWFVAFGCYVILLRLGLGSISAPILSYPAAIATTAVFHLRYVRTQYEFLVRPPWRDFLITSLCEWATCALAVLWISARVDHPRKLEMFFLSVAAATLVRYVLRKEFFQDVRGLRKEIRKEDLT